MLVNNNDSFEVIHNLMRQNIELSNRIRAAQQIILHKRRAKKKKQSKSIK
ncbi:hypothetical protein RS022_07340 [Candidatus Phytoplasma rubi]|uniref:30S ribosomal protein S20 n=1 Tax=Candidatus Phytoplasma rubi TaxID=399025 RepID=A0ABY7BSW8_9MOLU|nr:hypothetical protein RS022_07340 [Candidatus Phytoplasma rubi]